MTNMQRFAQQHVSGLTAPVRVLDVGALSVNGDYRELFSSPGTEYVGLDVEPGPNVDIVTASSYRWSNIRASSFDVVISGQAFEHIAFPWVTITEIVRVLRPGGLVCLIVPSAGPEHRYPVDCWRYYPDGLRALAAWAGLHVESCGPGGEVADGDFESALWGDMVLVARKPVLRGVNRFRAAVSDSAFRMISPHRANRRTAQVR